MSDGDTEACLYDRDGERFSPREHAGSPWSAKSQHGGPVNALFMEGAEAAAAEAGQRVVRLTVDLFRPVPMAPIERKTEFLRRGKRISVLDLRLEQGDTLFARATAQLLTPGGGDPDLDVETPLVPGPDGLETVSMIDGSFREALPPGFHWSLRIRPCGSDDAPGAWLHSPLDFTPGTPLSSGQLLAAVSDLCFGLGGRLQLRRLGREAAAPSRWINTDTTLSLERPPTGRWFSFQAPFMAGADGIGVAQVVLGDERGRLGLASQSLLAQAPPRS